MVLGDSHARSLFPGLASLAASEGTGITWALMSHPGCLPVLDPGGNMGLDEACSSFLAAALDAIGNMPSAKTVLLVSSSRALNLDAAPAQRWAQTLVGFQGIIRALQQQGRKVVWVIDNPAITDVPKRCSESRPIEVLGVSLGKQCSIPRAQHEAAIQAHRRIAGQLSESLPSLVVFDPTDLLCEPRACVVNRAGESLYQYTDHLSVHGARVVGAGLAPHL